MSNGSPPITSAPSPPSAPGTVQPVIMAGQSLPPSFPLGEAGTWLPPPEVGFGDNQLFPTPVVPAAPVPPSIAGVVQPQYRTGSATVPTAASLFPAFTAPGASPPIVVNVTQNVTTPPSPPGAPPVWVAPPFPIPTTPGIAPIVINGWGPRAGPLGEFVPPEPPEPEPPAEPEPEPPGGHVIASGGGHIPPLRPPKRGRGTYHRG
jgi:hypothetical protein